MDTKTLNLLTSLLSTETPRSLDDLATELFGLATLPQVHDALTLMERAGQARSTVDGWLAV